MERLLHTIEHNEMAFRKTGKKHAVNIKRLVFADYHYSVLSELYSTVSYLHKTRITPFSPPYDERLPSHPGPRHDSQYQSGYHVLLQ